LSSASFINSEAVVALDFDTAAAKLWSWGFLPESKYNSDAVENQLWNSWTIQISFQWKKALVSPKSSWELGVLVPGIIEDFEWRLWYVRSAAFSIAEACFQLNRGSESPLSVDQLKFVIIQEVANFLIQEIERISEYENQDNIILFPAVWESFESHRGRLEEKVEFLESFINANKISNHVEWVKIKLETIHKAANDEKY
jgi:hypothetical protein